MMYRLAFWITIFFLFVSSCERRPLTYDYQAGYVLGVHTDWLHLPNRPLGVSIRCYPRDGDKPTVIQSNNVDYNTVRLRSGIYDIVVFNQIPSDFTRLHFRGLDIYDDLEIYGVKSPFNKNSNKDFTYYEEPNFIAVDTMVGFEVTDDMVGYFSKNNGLVAAKDIYFTPPLVIYTMHINVIIKGIQYMRSVRANISNLACSYRFCNGSRSDGSATHQLDEWSLKSDAVDKTKGVLSTRLETFGLCDIDDAYKMFNMFIKLRDKEQTEIRRSFILDDLITEDNLTLKLDVTLDFGEPLPEIEIEGGGGFDAEVGDWDDDVIEDVEIH